MVTNSAAHTKQSTATAAKSPVKKTTEKKDNSKKPLAKDASRPSGLLARGLVVKAIYLKGATGSIRRYVCLELLYCTRKVPLLQVGIFTEFLGRLFLLCRKLVYVNRF